MDFMDPQHGDVLLGLTLSQITNFRFFQTESTSRRHYKFYENGRKFSKRVENTIGKTEIFPHKQFFLFFTVFSKDLYCRRVKTSACLGKG